MLFEHVFTASGPAELLEAISAATPLLRECIAISDKCSMPVHLSQSLQFIVQQILRTPQMNFECMELRLVVLGPSGLARDMRRVRRPPPWEGPAGAGPPPRSSATAAPSPPGVAPCGRPGRRWCSSRSWRCCLVSRQPNSLVAAS